MAKRILFNDEARKALKEGIDETVKAVSLTIGPRGQNVILSNGKQTNDGVSVARDNESSNTFKQKGIEQVQDVAESINELVGDATSTGVVIDGYLVTEGYKLISMGVNGMMLRKGMERAVLDAKEALYKMAKPIKSVEELKKPAIVSSESEEIGSAIADVVWRTGKNGDITVEESGIPGITTEIEDGFKFDKGYVSPYMCTDPQKMQAVIDDVPILVTDKKFQYGMDIFPIVKHAVDMGLTDLVIVAEDFGEGAVKNLIANRIRWFQFAGKNGGIKILAVKAASFGDKKKEFLDDLCVITKTSILSDFTEEAIKKIEKKDLGWVKKIISRKDSTTIIGSNRQGIIEYVSGLQMLLFEEKFEFQKIKIKERIARLIGGVAVLRVGAPSEKELKYLKDKIEDSINSTRHAMEDGIVPGGGASLVHAMKSLKQKRVKDHIQFDEFESGYQLVLRALAAPLRAIVENCGESPDTVLHNILHSSSNSEGFNAITKECGDLLKAGIVDPVKVISTALEVAVSGAAIFLTTGAVIVRDPEKDL